MEGFNRADSGLALRLLSKNNKKDVPCIFISYQRDDEGYARKVAEYIKDHQIDVFFDLYDINLKKSKDPKTVTNAITKGLSTSDYMLVIVSPSTYNSPWVPFEIGYAYENMEEKMKILRHKDLPKTGLPEYLKTKEILNGVQSLNQFLNSVRNGFFVYESVQERDSIKLFSSSNPLSNYLSNE